MEAYCVGLEQLLVQLATATDTESIRTATNTLSRQYFNNKNCVPALIEIITKSTQSQVRQLAAVEARKRVSKWWSKIDQNTQTLMKNHLLEVILREPERLVNHATARVISSIAKVELPAGTWNELPQFLYDCCKSSNSGQREVGIYVLYTLFDTITDVFSEHKQLFELFSVTINDPESKVVRVTTLQALGKVAESIDNDQEEEVQLFRQLIPSMVNVLQQCLTENDENSATECFEVFEALLTLEAPLLSNHIPQLIEFFLNTAQNKELDDSLRIMALQFLIWATVYKKTKIQRLKLLAFRVINTLSTNLPPAQVFPFVINHVVGYMQQPDPNYRKAAMMALAVLIEGCADYIRPKFNDLLLVVSAGLQDPETIVRRAACIALGCFAEELDEEIAANHATLLPLVFSLINDPSPDIPKHACNALDAILEGLGDEIVQYLPLLMEKLLIILDQGADEVKATVTAAIGSAAHAAGEEFKPYFDEVVKRLYVLMTINQGTEGLLLRGVATDTVGAVAEAVGKEVFKTHVHEIMKLAIDGMQLDSARLRECSYCLFAVMARVFQDEFAPYLEAVMPQLIKSCQIEEKDLFSINENQLEEEAEVDEDINEDDFAVNSAVVDEKEIAADAIGEIFQHTRGHFLPYVELCVVELKKLSNHYSEGVRKAVTCSLFSFLSTFYSMSDPAEWQPGLPLKVPIHNNVTHMIKAVMPDILLVWEDEESK
ncbi:8473_t:CDS:10 [Ambispora gerdemannii]|uniref:8473_t:CDS:1 n=1 Tax=Ambispora gerdemannii TaxID=144530 RepID=A0A9N9AXK2_9GLOM|nr:8473_t:CDS:10 [Ambispora gerdemannii]